MVYIPELDRQGFADRQSKQQRRNRPAVNFTRRDDVRDLMKSPMGKNYGNMMDLQNQAIRQGGFDKGDPKVAELKKARRQYNREDKYKIGNLMGYDPLEVQDMYRTNSEVLREHARPTYKKMYPVTDIARGISGSGGITGMLLNKAFGKTKKAGKSFFDDLRGMGRDILGGVGIGGADRDVSEKELDDYAERTFGFYPSDVHPGLPIEDPGLPIEDEIFGIDEMTDEEKIQELVDEKQRQIDNFETNTATELLDDMAKDQWPPSGYRFEFDDYVQDRMDALRNAPLDDIEPLPFDEGREDFIRGQNEYVPPVISELGIPNPQGGFDSFNKYANPDIDIEFGEAVVPPSIPFDDSFRESGIASMYGQGPMLGETNRRYEDEYRDHIERTGERMTYDEFEIAWERLHSLPRGLHYQEPRAGIR